MTEPPHHDVPQPDVRPSARRSPLTESPNTVTFGPDEVDGITDPDLRRLVVDALDSLSGPASRPRIGPRLTAYAAGRQCGTADLDCTAESEPLAAALVAAAEDDTILARLLEADGRYRGLTLAFAVTGSPWNQAVGADDHPDVVMPLSAGTPVIIGLAPSGRLAAVAAPDGKHPMILVTRTVIESAVFAGPVVRALFRVHAVLGYLDVGLTPDDVDAPLSALPVRLPPVGFGLEEDYAFLTVRWRSDQAPQGRVYPALPPGHPLGQSECVCKSPLGNGDHVSTLVLGPAPRDNDALARYHASRWHNAMAILLHRKCIPFALNVLFDTFQAIGAGSLSRQAFALDAAPEDYRDPYLTHDRVLELPEDGLRDLVLAAFRLETGGAATGWDTPPILNVLVDTSRAPDLDAPDVTALGVILGRGDGPTPLASFLATTLKTADGQVRRSLVHPTGSYWAVALVHEAWAYTGDPDEYEARWKGTRVADIPGAVEVRMVMLVADQFTIEVTRRRGGEPTAQVSRRGRSDLPAGDLRQVEADLRQIHRDLRTAYATRPAPPPTAGRAR